MFSDIVLVVRTGNPGSGKSYWAVKEIYHNLLEFYGRDMKIVTNLPLAKLDARIEVREFSDNALDNPTWEEFQNCVLILDEAQRWLTKKNSEAWKQFISMARHHDIRLQLLTQSKENFPDWVDDMIEVWYESANGRTERDEWIGLLMYDWAGIWAKLTGKFYNYFVITEYKKVERRWKAQGGHKEWFDPAIGKLYNSKNKSLTDTEVSRKTEDWERFGWVKFLRSVQFRNPGCTVKLFFKCMRGVVPMCVAFGVLVGGGAWLWPSRKVAPVALKPELIVAPKVEKPVEKPSPVAEAVAQVMRRPSPKVVKKRVTVWAVMCLAAWLSGMALKEIRV